ncbi:MAG: HepT-like ribonuclease domain-containing protein [Actinomycetota bacterium]
MSRDRQRLDDILRAIADADLIVKRGRSIFDADPLTIRAAKNIVTEIGEATKALSDDVKESIAGVPWRSIAGMRDRTIHRYPEVDLDVLWDTLAIDLPDLEQAIRHHLDPTEEA